jgi:NADPH:quinone reductase-like Zn-dependent oxidoreductase
MRLFFASNLLRSINIIIKLWKTNKLRKTEEVLMSLQPMQAIRVHDYGDIDQLQLEQITRPEPQEGEVLVRVHAAGVNPIDWKVRQGLRKNMLQMHFPYIPGMEIAGVVQGIGPGVTDLQVGQAVYGQSMKGGYAEYTTTTADSLGLKPQSLSFDEAAAVPVGAAAAWTGLFEAGKLEAGQRVLVQGAAGGVGLFAVQFARWKGAHVIATTSGANVEFVRSLGAETVIDYTTTALTSVVQDVDLVFNVVGGPTLEESVQALKRGGILVSLAGQPAKESVQEREVQVASAFARISAERLHAFAQLIDAGQIQVVIEKVFPLSEARQAQELSQRGHGRGRIVLHVA